jgi:hypothetical protein
VRPARLPVSPHSLVALQALASLTLLQPPSILPLSSSTSTFDVIVRANSQFDFICTTLTEQKNHQDGTLSKTLSTDGSKPEACKEAQVG